MAATPFVATLRNDWITASYRFRAGDYRIAFQIEQNFMDIKSVRHKAMPAAGCCSA
jgi:mRNA-degrading endonuclease RelE of RelBE toxin-antitoxin system